MASKTLDDAYNTLNLGLNDRKDFDHLFVFTDMSAATELAQRILIDKKPSKNLLTGIKGCGKTTELLRLLRDIEDSYFGVYCPMRSFADVRKVTSVDILLSALFQTVLTSAEKGVVLSEGTVKDLAAWLQETLPTTRVEFEERRLDQKGLADKIKRARAAMKAQTVRDSVQGSLEERKGEMVEKMDALINEIERVSNKRLLLAIDDLDKMPTDRAKDIFAEHGELLTSPGCKIVYTIPYSLVHSHEFRDVTRTFRKYVNQGPAMIVGRRSKDGMTEMRDIVSKRMPLELIEDKALLSVIEKTGGVVADLLRTLSEACIKARTEGKEVIDLKVVEAVLDDIRKDGTRTLSATDCALLSTLYKQKTADYDDTFLRLLDDGYILEYVGEEGKYYTHPLVVPVLKDKKLI
jgi:hypothetical protein